MTDIPQTRQHLLHGLSALAEGAKLKEKANEGRLELQLIQRLKRKRFRINKEDQLI